ncbi:uncharacterized protein [Henckelia pumila]|uniref:uncharacterized protein n=1 Tax=Henckelia pumila TaxID=405737 RepID=UPI003C6E4AD1
MESLHFVEYSGKTIETTVTNKASVAENWLRNMMRSWDRNAGLENKIVGIDCKCFPPLNPADSSIFANKIATLQLCMDTKCLVLQLPHMDYVPAQCFLQNLLANSGAITLVGVEVEKMWHKITSDYGLEYSRHDCKVVDVHLLAKAWFPMSYRGRPSLKALAYGVAGLSKRKSTVGEYYNRHGADWGSKILDQELVQQACVDAYVSYAIAHTLLKDP